VREESHKKFEIHLSRMYGETQKGEFQ